MSDHIQMADAVPRVLYTGNGIQTSFTYPFPIFIASQLHVYINGAEQLTGFVVLNAGKTTGGTVQFDTAPESGVKVTLERIIPVQRVSDFIEGGELAANALNNEFDTLTAIAQQLEQAQKAMLHFSGVETLPETELPLSTARRNKVLGFDGVGAPALFETSATYASPTSTQTGAGAVARTLVDKAKEFVSVKDFGATGDGSTNDRTAIVNALAAHANIYFPPGTYRITSGIEIGDHKILRGAGGVTVIKASANTFDTVSMIGKNSQISDMVIDGGETALRLYGKAAPCVTNHVRNLTIRNAAIGIELDGYSNTTNVCDGNILSGIVIEKPTQYGLLVTRSGAGKYPNANKFSRIRVTSLGTSISGAGFFLEAAKYNTSLIDCEAYLSGTPAAVVRVGPESDKTLLINLYCEASNLVPNIQLDNGSIETSIINLYSNSNGAAIADNSGGNYLAFNAGYPNKTRLNRTAISDLTVSQKRYTFETVAFALPNTVIVDLSKTTYLIDANSAETTVQLPKAAVGNSGAVVTLKKTDASSKFVLVTENSGNGPDGRIFKMGSQHDIVTVMSDGSVWRVIHTNIPSFNANYISTAGTHTPDITRQLHTVSAASGLTIVELPPANNATSIGRFLTIKKTDATTNAVRITESGATGPDNTIVNLTAMNTAITVMSNGSAWYTIAKV